MGRRIAMPTKGEIWQHVKSGKTYVIEGSAFNTITDALDIVYKPHAHQSEYRIFTRQLKGHPKAFLSFDGKHHRFVRVAANAEDYMQAFFPELSND